MMSGMILRASQNERKGERLFYAPSPMQPLANGGRGYTDFSRPLAQCLRTPAKRDGVVVAPVVGLFGRGCPATVLGRVRAVIVDALDSVFSVRSWSHVRVKGGKILPPFTDCYPSTAVNPVMGRFGAEAAAPHQLPDGILGGAVLSVPEVQPAGSFPFQASTRPNLAAQQEIRPDGLEISAIAAAFPISVSVLAWGGRQDNEAAKPFSGRNDFHTGLYHVAPAI